MPQVLPYEYAFRRWIWAREFHHRVSMLHQIVRQQVCLLRKRIRSSQITFLQSRTRAAHIVSDLTHRLLLSRVERAFRQQFQLVVGRAQQPFRVLALAGRFRRS